jgi:phosphoglycolate phosphatase-like HAD superfamily hydrolase
MQNKDSVKLLIFDFDGTLVQLRIDWEELKKELRKLLGSKSSLTPLFPSIEALTKNNSELRKKAWRLIEKYESEAVKEIKADFELIELFKKLKTRHFQVALLTLQGRQPLEKALRKLGLQGVFDNIITREETASREQQIKKMLKLFKVKPNQAMVIADRLHDILIASKLGCKTVAITDKRNLSADYKFADVKQIATLFNA